ncbi:MAG: hypothetical protein ACI90V_002713, partial [Bacillariaceae sp.]
GVMGVSNSVSWLLLLLLFVIIIFVLRLFGGLSIWYFKVCLPCGVIHGVTSVPKKIITHHTVQQHQLYATEQMPCHSIFFPLSHYSNIIH